MATFWLSFITHGDPNPKRYRPNPDPNPKPYLSNPVTSPKSYLPDPDLKHYLPNPNPVFNPNSNPNPNPNPDPNPNPNPNPNPTWPPYTLTQDNNMVFALESDGGVTVESGYRKTECDYWDTLPGGPDS